MAKQVI